MLPFNPQGGDGLSFETAQSLIYGWGFFYAPYVPRRQADPADPEFKSPNGGAPKGNTNAARDKTTNSNTGRCKQRDDASKPGTLRRLARSRPDLLARIEAGELTVHAAAIEAGIRRPMRSVPVDSPEAAIA